MSNIAIVKDFIAAWEAQDLDRVMGFFTPDAVYHNIPMPIVNGLADIRKTIAGFIGMGDKLVFETHHIAETSGGAVMTERTDKFLMSGQWLELPVMGVFEIKDGKITKWRDYFDLGQFQSQLAKINSQKVAGVSNVQYRDYMVMLARIYQPSKNAMQSGKSNSQMWVVEFESEAAKKIEPLMGWTSASDMRNTELRLRFDSREAAIAFADKHGLAYQVIEPRKTKRVLKAYADNFRADRTAPWTH